MPRPKIKRLTKFEPNVVYFKPRGVPLRDLEEVSLEKDELEALKLYEIDNLDQNTASKKMIVSQPTFARILGKAHKKLASAIVLGKAVKLIS